MKQISRWGQVSLVAVAALALLVTGACSSDTSPSSLSPTGASAAAADVTALGSAPDRGGPPQGGNQGGPPGSNPGDCQGDCAAGPLTNEVLAALGATLQDEYKAEAVYNGVLSTFGAGTLPFANIVRAEQQHAASIVALYTSRGLSAPAKNLPAIPTFDTVKAACAAGVVAERENVALYDQYLTLTLPTDVRNVLTNNRRASLEGHLPAFQRCD